MGMLSPKRSRDAATIGDVPRLFQSRNRKQWVTVTLRSEEHTSELQSLMRISYAVFCLKKKTKTYIRITTVRKSEIIKETKVNRDSEQNEGRKDPKDTMD